MEISGVALQPAPSGIGTGQKSDPSAEIQKLVQRKEDLKQQLRRLEQNQQGEDTVKNAKEKLQKQMKEIDQQIQILRQQATAAQPKQDVTKPGSPRFDEYVKNDMEPSDSGIYNVEQDQNGNPSIQFESPKKRELQNAAQPDKQPVEE